MQLSGGSLHTEENVVAIETAKDLQNSFQINNKNVFTFLINETIMI